jgi:K+/H+ antiporter YhaU regulatory subunit KhtT
LKHLRIHEVLELVEIEDGSAAIGANPTTLALRRRTGVVQIAVVRRGKPIYQRDPTFSYEVGDTVVLVGDFDGLARAMALFRFEGALPDAPDASVVLDNAGDGQV